MILKDDGYDARPRKLADGLYRFRSGEHVWIEGGVLFLPVAALDLMAAQGYRYWIRNVEDECGRARLFIRASDVMKVSPELAVGIQAVAAKYQCEV